MMDRKDRLIKNIVDCYKITRSYLIVEYIKTLVPQSFICFGAFSFPDSEYWIILTCEQAKRVKNIDPFYDHISLAHFLYLNITEDKIGELEKLIFKLI